MSKLAESRQCGASASKSQRGFTLLELITAVTVVSVLLTVAVPSFFNITRNSRAAANANELVSAISVARSEAIRRGARVSVCRSTNGTSCNVTAGASWATGWIVAADSQTNDALAPTVAEVLRVWPAPSGNTVITTRESDGDAVDMAWIRFLPRGTVRVPGAITMPVSYGLVVEGCSGTQARSIELNTIGRTRVTSTGC